jgi:hypothetical protein
LGTGDGEADKAAPEGASVAVAASDGRPHPVPDAEAVVVAVLAAEAVVSEVVDDAKDVAD